MTNISLTSIDYAIFALYLGVLTALGLYLKKRASKGLEHYLLGNRSMPWWMLGISGVMDFWDLAGSMIIVSFLFLLGPQGLYIEFRGGAVLTLAVAMLWAGKWHRRSGCLTGAEWMLFRFGDGPAGKLAQLTRAGVGLTLTVGMIAYLAKGVGLFLSVFLPFPPMPCAFALIGCATIYSIFSGFYGVVVIHLLQFAIVLTAAVTIIFYSMSEVSSFSSLAEKAAFVTGNMEWGATWPTVRATMPAGYESYEPLLMLVVLYLLRNLLFGMGSGDDPKYYAARTDKDCAKLSLLWVSLIALRWPMMMGLAVLGISVVYQLLPDADALPQAVQAIRQYYPDESWETVSTSVAASQEDQPVRLISRLEQLLGSDWRSRLPLVSQYGTINAERVIPYVLMHAIPAGLRSLIIVSLLASAMAGFSSWINQSAGFFTNDLYLKYLRPKASVRELMTTTWLFILGIVAAGCLLAATSPTINSVWSWIIMGLGSGMIFPQLLPLYWRRFNGVGYTAGMLAGVLTAFTQRIATPWLGRSWAFLNEEWFLLPAISVIGLIAAVAGTLLSAPTPTAVLQNFFNRTLPFGAWGLESEALSAPLRQRLKAEHLRDTLSLPIALTYQVFAFLTPMLVIIHKWQDAVICAIVTLGALLALHLLWLRYAPESDAIVAEAKRELHTPSEL